MVVEDPTAYVERLEIPIDDRRSAKGRQREARARVKVHEAETELRLAIRFMHDLESRADRSGVDRIRRHVAALQAELRRRRERLRSVEQKARELDERRRKAVMVRLHSASHYVDSSEERYERLSAKQARLPCLLLRKDGRQWWWYRNRFWWADARLGAREVDETIRDADLVGSLHRHLLDQARGAALGADAAELASNGIPESVRLAVWRRDNGRCVDCGTTHDVRFEGLEPEAKAAPTPETVRLRCRTCSALRAQPGAQALTWDGTDP